MILNPPLLLSIWFISELATFNALPLPSPNSISWVSSSSSSWSSSSTSRINPDGSVEIIASSATSTAHTRTLTIGGGSSQPTGMAVLPAASLQPAPAPAATTTSSTIPSVSSSIAAPSFPPLVISASLTSLSSTLAPLSSSTPTQSTLTSSPLPQTDSSTTVATSSVPSQASPAPPSSNVNLIPSLHQTSTTPNSSNVNQPSTVNASASTSTDPDPSATSSPLLTVIGITALVVVVGLIIAYARHLYMRSTSKNDDGVESFETLEYSTKSFPKPSFPTLNSQASSSSSTPPPNQHPTSISTNDCNPTTASAILPSPSNLVESGVFASDISDAISTISRTHSTPRLDSHFLASESSSNSSSTPPLPPAWHDKQTHSTSSAAQAQQETDRSNAVSRLFSVHANPSTLVSGDWKRYDVDIDDCNNPDDGLYF